MIVLNIVEQYLQANGFDGLVSGDRVCSCVIGNLAPCGEVEGDCEAGLKVEGCTVDCGAGCRWHIAPGKGKCTCDNVRHAGVHLRECPAWVGGE